MYLEERVAILEDMLHRIINAHPELCPHTFEEIGSTTDCENKVVKVHYKCRTCGAEETQEHKIEKPLGYFAF